MQQFTIQRKVIPTFTYFYQPFILFLLYTLVSRTQSWNAIGSLIFTLIFACAVGYYIYFNFVRPRNEVYFIFDGDNFGIAEPENPELENTEYQITELQRLWIDKEKFNGFFLIGSKLFALHGEAHLELLNLQDFLYGGIEEADLDEVIDYIEAQNPNVKLGRG